MTGSCPPVLLWPSSFFLSFSFLSLQTRRVFFRSISCKLTLATQAYRATSNILFHRVKESDHSSFHPSFGQVYICSELEIGRLVSMSFSSRVFFPSHLFHFFHSLFNFALSPLRLPSNFHPTTIPNLRLQSHFSQVTSITIMASLPITLSERDLHVLRCGMQCLVGNVSSESWDVDNRNFLADKIGQ